MPEEKKNHKEADFGSQEGALAEEATPKGLAASAEGVKPETPEAGEKMAEEREPAEEVAEKKEKAEREVSPEPEEVAAVVEEEAQAAPPKEKEKMEEKPESGSEAVVVTAVGAVEKPVEAAPGAEAEAETGPAKKKKIRLMSVEEIDKTLARARLKMGGDDSVYIKHLLDRKAELEGTTGQED